MQWTWAQIVSDALVLSGILGIGQVPNADQEADGLRVLDLLLDELDGEGLALPAFDATLTFDTVSGQAMYTLGGIAGDTSIRPETIITATCTIQLSPIVNNELVPISYNEYSLIPVPSTSGQPWNYALNETWPAMQIYLYPVPATIYPINLNCKIKWADTVGDPSVNPFAVASVPSGYVNGLIDILTLKLAQKYRLQTDTHAIKAGNARFMFTSMVYAQNKATVNKMPIGLFPWNIGISGRNPW